MARTMCNFETLTKYMHLSSYQLRLSRRRNESWSSELQQWNVDI